MHWAEEKTAVHVLDGGGVAGECAGEQVHEAGLADAGSTRDQELERQVSNNTPYVFPGQTVSGLLGPVRLILKPGNDRQPI